MHGWGSLRLAPGRLFVCLGAALGVIVGTASPAAAASGNIPFTVKSVGAAQSNAPVFTGIPFPPGELRDAGQVELFYNGQSVPRQVKVLSSYPDGSLRVVLIGFRATVAAGQKLTASIRYGVGQGAPLSPAMPWVRNLDVLAMCAPAWYGRSGVFNMRFSASDENTLSPEFETRMKARFTATSDPPSHTHPDYRNYYDHVHASYMTLLRTGGPDHAPRLIWEEVYEYRENEILHSGPYVGQYHAGSRTGNAYPMPPDLVRRTYLLGLLEDYYFTGDERSLAVAVEIGGALLKDSSLTTSRFTISERLVGFALMGLCAIYEQNLDPQYLAAARAVAKVAMDHQDAMAVKYPNQGGLPGVTGAFVHDKNGRWDDPEESSASGCGSPWMTGILAEAMGRLYWLTGDTRVRSSVVRAANWAATAAFIAANDPRNHSRKDALWYICKASDNDEIYPALNPLTFFMFGFAYQVTSDPRYLALSERLLTADMWGRTIKEFNQAMRSAPQGIYLLQMSPGSVPLTLAESGGEGATLPVAPGVPASLTAKAGDQRVVLAWAAGGGSNPSGYYVYRSSVRTGGYSRLTASPVTASTFVDTGVTNGATYWYCVSAVGSSGAESATSAPVSATPTAPAAQTYTISGTVSVGGSGVGGVLVTGGGQSAVTGSNGAYTLSNIAAGTYTLTATKSGYKISAALTVTVGPSRSGVDFTATVDAPAVSDGLIYTDTLRSAWSAARGRAQLSLASTKVVAEGKRAIAFTVRGVDGYVELTGAGMSVAGKQYLKFSIHGGSRGGQALRVRSIVDGGQQENSLNLSQYGGLPVANGWKEYAIPLADLKAASGNLTGVKFFAGNRQKTVYIDHIRVE